MATTQVNLQLNVDSSRATARVGEVRREFDRLNKEVAQNGRAATTTARRQATLARNTDSLGRSASTASRGFGLFRSAIVGVVGLGLGRVLVNTAASFETLRLRLKVFEGDAASAAARFAELQGYAARTPFSLQQVVEGYLRLEATNFEPDLKSFEALGNIAAASGRDVLSLADAIAAVGRGENDPIEGFGFQVRKQGEQVRIQFKDTVKVVEDSRTAILAAFAEIGNAKFSGATEELANSLTGALSNLRDSLDQLADQFGQGGFSAAVADLSRDLSELGGNSQRVARNLGAATGKVIEHIDVIATLVVGYATYRTTVGLVVAKQNLLNTAFFKSIRAARGAATAAVAARGLLTALGGPIGLIITGLTTAAGAWLLFRDDGKAALSELQNSVEDFTASLVNMTRAQQQHRLNELIATRETLRRENADDQQRVDDLQNKIVKSQRLRSNPRLSNPSTEATYSAADRSIERQITKIQAGIDNRNQELDKLSDFIGVLQDSTLGGLSNPPKAKDQPPDPDPDPDPKDTDPDAAAREAEQRLRDLKELEQAEYDSAVRLASLRDDEAEQIRLRYAKQREQYTDLVTHTEEEEARKQAILADLATAQQAELDALAARNIEREKETADATIAEIERVATEREEAEKSLRAAAEKSLTEYAEEAKNAGKNIDQVLGRAFQNAEDALVNFVKTGKLEFGTLVQDIIDGLLRIAIQQAILGPLASALGGLFAGGGATPNPAAPLGSPGYIPHAGGVVGSLGGRRRMGIPANTFFGARRYHRGGLVLGAGEVPIIAQRGEEVLSRQDPRNVRNGGTAAAPNIQVNIINRSSQPLRGEQQGNPQEVMGDMVVGVMVEDLSKHGPFSRAFESVYGVQPGVAA